MQGNVLNILNAMSTGKLNFFKGEKHHRIQLKNSRLWNSVLIHIPLRDSNLEKYLTSILSVYLFDLLQAFSVKVPVVLLLLDF